MASKNEENDPDFEHILRTVGTTGRLNKAIFITASFCGIVNALNTFSYGFLGFTPPYWCHSDALADNDWTMEQRRNMVAPFSDGKYDGCQMYDVDYSRFSGMRYSEAKSRMDAIVSRDVRHTECDKREFNTTVESTVTKWDLVCERRVLYSTTQAVIQFGMLLGSGIIGFLIDRFGRKRMFVVCTVCISVVSFSTIFSRNVWIFIILRMASSLFGIGLYMAGFILAVELSLPDQRSFTGNVFSVPWGVGIMVLPGIAYMIRPWYYLQLAFSIPTLFLFLGIWILPESPRWLIINGRYEEAYKVLKRISKSNMKAVPDKNQLMKTMIQINALAGQNTVGESSKSILQKMKGTFSRIVYIVAEPTLRRQSLIVFYCWFAVAIVYYGVSLGSPVPNQDSNTYLYMFLGGLVEVASYISLWPITKYFGRKKTLTGCYAICSISVLTALFVATFSRNPDLVVWPWISFLVGKFAITSAFKLIWLFTAELYPTNYRSIAVGEASTVARIGSIFSSYINDLLVLKLPWGPAAIFSGLSAIAAFCVLFLPETTNENLPDYAPKTNKMNGYGNRSVDVKE